MEISITASLIKMEQMGPVWLQVSAHANMAKEWKFIYLQ